MKNQVTNVSLIKFQLMYILRGVRVIALLGAVTLFLNACVQREEKSPPPNALNKFEEFKNKVKFIPDTSIYYPGIADAALRPALSEKINLAADDFKKTFETDKATDKAYQDQIKIGLDRFNDLYLNLDTEDRERICSYFEELMDIVGLKSSDGLLNNFMYGFDPARKQ